MLQYLYRVVQASVANPESLQTPAGDSAAVHLGARDSGPYRPETPSGVGDSGPHRPETPWLVDSNG
jgi:hypothetical protein